MVKGLEDIHEPTEADLADVEIEGEDVLVVDEDRDVDIEDDGYLLDEEYADY